MAKIGRNELCPCGSSKKFKRCHDVVEQQIIMPNKVKAALARANAQSVQRERQQGLGRSIISAEVFGKRFVAVNNRVYHSDKWKTFHDFLFHYIIDVLDPAWGQIELAKPLEDRHPILVWFHYVCELQNEFFKDPEHVNSAPMNGAAGAYLHLAYDLYALGHNVELQAKLIQRLRNRDNFDGARYEVYVAAILIRAGFTIEFENEDDHSQSHCEFNATFTKTGKSFSVEAKHRAGTTNKFRLGRQLNRALAKQADHTRIVFIDINVPDNASNDDVSHCFGTSLNDLRTFEGKIINGKPLPSAYLFVTNSPWHHHLAEENIRCSVMIDGFQIPDFKANGLAPSLRAVIEAREKHIEMHQLIKSMQDHSGIPATFDGEIPEFTFGNSESRLCIGNRYWVKNAQGEERAGLMTSATVSEKDKVAHCALTFEDCTGGIYTWPLSDMELSAWCQHPDTFFGEVGQRTTKANSPLEIYDFFYNSYRNIPRNRLLELMNAAPDYQELRQLDQPALASIYAERTVYGAMALNPEINT